MDLSIAKAFSTLLLPPVNIALLLLLALWWRKRACGWATASLVAGGGLLVALSMPLVADVLCRQVEVYPPLSEAALADTEAGAIVVLAGGWRRAPEYTGPTVNSFSLERLTHGVWLHRRTGLPLAVTGGRVRGSESVSEAGLMAGVLADGFGVEPHWVETRSRNTAENARFSAPMLKESGIEHILLVTHAFHMARAVPLFEAQGIAVTPAPMAFYASPEFRYHGGMLVPSAKALWRSYLALHELLGQAWYSLRYS
jgi:uncharacterized SAM-binding protein YcdF (DUF218 family)